MKTVCMLCFFQCEDCPIMRRTYYFEKYHQVLEARKLLKAQEMDENGMITISFGQTNDQAQYFTRMVFLAHSRASKNDRTALRQNSGILIDRNWQLIFPSFRQFRKPSKKQLGEIQTIFHDS